MHSFSGNGAERGLFDMLDQITAALPGPVKETAKGLTDGLSKAENAPCFK